MHGPVGLGGGDELERIRVRKSKVARIYYKRKIFQLKKKKRREWKHQYLDILLIFFSPSIIKKQTVWLWQKFIPGYVYNLENEVE